MNLIQSSLSLTKHNITIVTLLSGPMVPENNKNFTKKKPREKQTSNSSNENPKSNSNPN